MAFDEGRVYADYQGLHDAMDVDIDHVSPAQIKEQFKDFITKAEPQDPGKTGFYYQ